jgi:hypothetical protein
MNLVPNTVIQWTGTNTTERILCATPGGDGFYCIALESMKAWPVFKPTEELVKALENFDATLTEDTLAASLRREDLLTAPQRLVRDRAWKAIESLVNDPNKMVYRHRRGVKPIEATARTHGISAKSITRYLRRYWQYGQTPNALQAQFSKCGAPNSERLEGTSKLGRRDSNGQQLGIRITEAVQEQFARTIDKLVVGKGKEIVPFTMAFERLLENYYSTGMGMRNGLPAPILVPPTERPTFKQFRYFFEKEYGVLAALKGKFAGPHYDQNFKEITTVRTQTALGVGDAYEIDATTADAYVLHSKINDPEKRNNVVGRPTIYFAIDVFSELVAGLAVTFANASYDAAGLAIWNAYTDKTEYCKSIGLTLDNPAHWPSRGIPHSYRADRGELASHKSDTIAKNLGIVFENVQAYSPRAKALVERHFKLRNDRVIRWLPGAVPDDEMVKGHGDYRKKAALTLEEFTQALALAVIEHNTSVLTNFKKSPAMIEDMVEPRPYKIWEWGLTHANKLREMDPMLVRLGLLPAGDATVTERGIRFRGLFYTCPKARLEEWFSQSNAFDQTWRIRVSYDPGSVDYIYLLGKSVADTEICELQSFDRQFAGWTWAEADHFHKLERKSIREGQREDEAARVATGAQIHQIAQDAIARRKANGAVDVSQLKEMEKEHQEAQVQKNTEDIQSILGLEPLPLDGMPDGIPAPKTQSAAEPVPNPVEARWNKIRDQKKKERESHEESGANP